MSVWNTAQWNGGGSEGSVSVSVTARGLIYGALRLLGVLTAGRTASEEQMADGLSALNEMIDGWNNERLNIFAITRTVFDIAAGQQQYTLGVGGDWDTVRPQKIEAAGFIQGDTELPVRVLRLLDWSNFILKATSSTLPLALYADGAFPLLNVSLWPAPSVDAQLALYAWQPLSGFADLDTEYSFPPGYAQALRWNLADRLSPEFVIHFKIPQPRLDEIGAKAHEYLGKVKRGNAPQAARLMRCDPALTGGGLDPASAWLWSR